MGKYRKKPVVIDAVNWDGKNLIDMVAFCQDGRKPDLSTDISRDRWQDYESGVIKSGFYIQTLEGKMRADIGDYIIKGIKGEFYPCKPDIFLQTYEKVD